MADQYIFETLQTLCTAAGVGGQSEIVSVAKQMLKEYTNHIEQDAVGNLVAVLPAKSKHTSTVLLEAHMDEIGFVVTHIDAKGFLKVSACGGIDRRCIEGAKVTIWGTTAIPGVFCSTPPHLRDHKNDAVISAEAMFIDAGFSSDEQAAKYVEIGNKVSFCANFKRLHDHVVSSKALDNRAGMTAVLYALHLLKNKLLKHTIKVLFSCGEELGCRGAGPGSFAADADMAVITDVSFAYSPGAKREECGEMGKGVMLGISPILSHASTCAFKRTLDARNIPYQTEVMGGKTGTNADTVGVVGAGIPTVLVSIPLKYMHTPAEVVDLEDIRAVGESIAAFLEEGEWNV